MLLEDNPTCYIHAQVLLAVTILSAQFNAMVSNCCVPRVRLASGAAYPDCKPV